MWPVSAPQEEMSVFLVLVLEEKGGGGVQKIRQQKPSATRGFPISSGDLIVLNMYF